MCGLTAIYAYHPSAPPVDEGELLRIREAMHPRGPDAAGVSIREGGRLGLAHRRLAILDLDARADQPMVSGCGRWHIVYNGEIYNWRELRRELEAEGVVFRTTSDSEVLLHWFARRGVEGLCRLRGMYAFVFWDGEEKRLWLVRDPFGIKPLYYHDDGGTVRAASQVKALLAGGAVTNEPEPAGIVGFLLWGSVPEPWTTVAGIRAVPAGYVVEIDSLRCHAPRAFLDLPGWLRDCADDAPGGQAPFGETITESVSAHLVADVPVGLFLSSGIDSCAIAAALARLGAAGRTTAITLGFEEFAGWAEDEVPLAARFARRTGMRHRVRRVGATEFREDLPRFLEAMDQPTIDGLNTWFVAKAAREQGLKAVLSGLGGDELCAGYDSFTRVPRYRRNLAWARIVPGAGRLWQKLACDLPWRGSAAHPKLEGLLAHGGRWPGAYRLVRGLFLPHELPRFLDRDLLRAGLRRLADSAALHAVARNAGRNRVGRVAALEACWYMRHQLLRDADWTSMAHGLEVRLPFVDLPVWRRLHPAVQRQPGKGRMAGEFGLPAEIVDRPKTGFTTPIESWLDDIAPQGRDDPRLAPWARRWALWVAERTFPGVMPRGSVAARSSSLSPMVSR